MSINTKGPGALGSYCLAVEVHDLRQRMNPRISPASTMHNDRMIRYCRKRVFKVLLHRVTVFLALPTTKRFTVVLYRQGYSHAPYSNGPHAFGT